MGQGDIWFDNFAQVRDAEHQAIKGRTKRPSQRIWTGISLSGGGIRSAAFCLGALQEMARSGVLSRIDYISTVSGGGYIGAGLQWWLSQDPNSGADKKTFPYGVESDLAIDREKGQSILQYLRWHANYLLPGNGLDIFSALTVVVRTALLSLAIWFPLIVLFFFALQWLATFPVLRDLGAALVNDGPLHDLYGHLCPSPQPNWPDKQGCLSVFYALSLYLAAAGLVAIVVLSVVIALTSITKFPERLSTRFVVQSVVIGALSILIFVFCAGLLVFLSRTRGATLVRPDWTTLVTLVVGVTIGLGFLLPVINLVGMLVFGEGYKNADYSLRRFIEKFGGKLLRFTTYAAIFGTIPLVYSFLSKPIALPSGAASLISGLVAAFLGHLGQSRQTRLGRGLGALAAVAASFFLYGVVLTAYYVSSFLFNPDLATTHYYYLPLGLGVVLISIIFGIGTNSNTTGLHRFYRDRLMELFMPSVDSVKAGISDSSFAADRLSVRGCWDRPGKPIALFPIINCNAILVNDPDPIIASRGGSNFAITPLHVGGSIHGWECSGSYERKNREISLATAIAASGAAANANSGYAGGGPTRNRFVSLVLTLFNIRLGVWVRRPSASVWRNVVKATPFFPNLWYGPFAQGYKTTNAFVEISDGGHFENLGIYELVRRRVDLIIALDGEADPTTSLPALISAARRIEEDFRATLTFDTPVDELIPTPPAEARYPGDARFAKSPCAKATIKYLDDPTKITTLIYIKATLTDQMSFTTRGYRARHADYPNESTANQFYYPEQFDAYRELGQTCARTALKVHGSAIDEITPPASATATTR
jgi:hypothetical protein